MTGCILKNLCGFFLHFESRQSRTWKVLTGCYCRRGRLHRQCRNWVDFQQYGTEPNGERMPSGERVPEMFLRLK